jgi:hypothetical protein
MISSLWIVLWPSLICWARAGLTNVTTDDSSPDPRTGNRIVYDPPTASNTRTLYQNGPGKCSALPDVNTVFDGTWHEYTVGGESMHIFNIPLMLFTNSFKPSLDRPSNDFPNTVLTARIQFDGLSTHLERNLSHTFPYMSTMFLRRPLWHRVETATCHFLLMEKMSGFSPPCTRPCRL